MIEKYSEIVSAASYLQREKGYVDLDELMRLYYDDVMKLTDDALYFNNFMAQVEKDTGVKPRIFSSVIEPLNALKVENIGKLRPYAANVITCKRFFTKPTPNGSEILEEEYRGILEIGGEKYRYVSDIPLTLGEAIIWAIPRVREDKKGVEVYFRVYGAQEKIADYGLMTLAEIAFTSLEDVRRVYPKIVGEDVNVALCALSLASRLNKNRGFWIMGIVIQGRSSSGKSYFMQNILAPFAKMGRVEEFTRFTGAYLERKFAKLNKNMDDMILAIYELFADTPEQLHLTLSEGKLRVGIIDKETGEPIEFTFEGMPFLFSTTPFEALRPDIRNRIINISIDESDEQTKRILEFETMLAEDPQKAVELDEAAEKAAARFAKYFESLEKKYVVVPYARRLLEALTFYDVKLRRDWKKLFSLLQASALLFQKYRPKVKLSSGEEAVVATLEDFENLLYVMPAFRETLINLSKSQKMLIDIMREEGQDEYTRKELAVLAHKRGWKVSQQRISEVLSELIALGYVAVDESGRAHKYSLLKYYSDVDFAKLRSAVAQDCEAFLKAHGIALPKDLYNVKDVQANCNFSESAENRLSTAQKAEIDDDLKPQPGIEPLSPLNSIQTGLASNESPEAIQGSANPMETGLTCESPVSPVAVSDDHEFPGTMAQKGEKPENQKTCRSPNDLSYYLNLSEGGEGE
ncbi:MAG: hypothetical protein QW692_00540 [Nitrososphaerota archaeon]